MKLMFIFLISLSPLIILADSYSDSFEKDGRGDSYADHYEKEGSGVDPFQYYEEHTVQDPSSSQNLLDSDGTDFRQLGKDIGASVTDRISTEELIKQNVMDPLQSTTEMRTLGDTYVCEADNNTYPDINECKSECTTLCKILTFKPEMSCQKSLEVINVTPSHIGNNPELKITFNNKTFTTLPVTAICVNGYISNGYTFEWILRDNELVAINTANDRRNIGECEDLNGKSLMSYTRNYYNYLGYALTNLISKFGYAVTSPEIKTMTGGMIGLTVNAIVSGSCQDGALKSAIPHADLIHAKKGGGDVQLIADDDPIYKALTSDQQYSVFRCSITNRPEYVDGNFQLKFQDGCKVVKPTCTLVNESICDIKNRECVYTVSSKIPTKNYPPKMCNEVLIGSSNHNICADGNRITVTGATYNFQLPGKKYLTVNRDYECTEDKKEEYDFSSWGEQSNMISSTAEISEDGTYTYNYTDKDGNVQTSTSNYELGKVECEQSCRVQMPANIATDNKTILMPDDTSVSRVIDPVMYKKCKLKTDVWTCELEDGETMITDCDCPNDFVDTIVKLKTVDELSKNMKCSTR